MSASPAAAADAGRPRTSTHAPHVIPSIRNSLFSDMAMPCDTPSSSFSGSSTFPSVACRSLPAPRILEKKADIVLVGVGGVQVVALDGGREAFRGEEEWRGKSSGAPARVVVGVIKKFGAEASGDAMMR